MESMKIARALSGFAIWLIIKAGLATGFAASLTTIVGTLAHAAPMSEAPPSHANGPLKTVNAEYRMGPAVDPDVLANQATEVWARVFRPAELVDPAAPNQKRPLLLFLHGNHGTCGTGSPRTDGNCEYTNTGTCPTGYVVTPNHEGYNYVAENLASWGYVVVSINANRGITCGGGNSEDWGLILARGRLVLRHLQLWNEWSTTGGAPSTLGLPNLFKGNIDLANVGLMGHSRGGEGVRAALNLYRDPGSPWISKIPGLDIRAIYEIGAVDGQSNRVLDAPSVAWNQTLPLCDGDVSNLEGRMPFERMLSRFSVKGEAETRPSPKSLTMVWGANHNFFNTEWQSSDSYGCAGEPTHKAIFDQNKSASLEQQAIARQSMAAFFRAHVGSEREPELGRNFDPAYAFPTVFSAIGNVDRDYISGYELAKSFRVDDFTAATGLNAAGPKNLVSAVNVSHSTDSEPPVANISWTKATDDHFYQMNFKDIAQSSNVSSFDFLDLRVGRSMSDLVTELSKSINFSAQLVASDNTLSNAVAIGDHARVFGPPNEVADLTQTVRIPLSSFGVFDFKDVRGVRLVFNRTPKGKVRIAHVRFSVKPEKMTTFDRETFASLLEYNSAIYQFTELSQPAMMDTQAAATTPVDMILPAESRSIPFSLSGAPPSRNNAQHRASWMKPRKISRSRELQGRTAYEIFVSSAEGFPVMDALPVLNVENQLFPIARFPSSGQTHILIFTISKESFDSLPMKGRAQVQYGLKRPSRIWTLPDFDKQSLQKDLTD